MPSKAGEPHKYRGVADDLRGRISAGDFDVERKLPGERHLRDHYGVSLMTVRQALGVLRDEGLIEARQGSGWFLAEWKPIVRNALRRLYSEHWDEARSMWDVDVEGRQWEVVDPQVDFPVVPDDVARVLGLESGAKAWRRDRKYVVDAVPVMRATSYIPDEFARDTRITEIDTGEGGIYARLEEAGHEPVAFREQVRCRLATPAEVDDLHLAAGAPVIEQHRVASQEDGRVVELNRMVLDASRFLLVYDF
ncbi:GntR family transcriptional regulator [Streptomyces sp. NPDC056670]|uniref:GntR family transcriptional regulator n=1 Tax=Streptomyces sp. NPDC056670 TaxID=3345904 RepID=UPI003691B3C8